MSLIDPVPKAYGTPLAISRTNGKPNNGFVSLEIHLVLSPPSVSIWNEIGHVVQVKVETTSAVPTGRPKPRLHKGLLVAFEN